MRFLHIIASARLEDGGPIEGVLRLREKLKAMGHSQELLTLEEPGEDIAQPGGPVIHAMGRRASGTGLAARFRRWHRRTPEAITWLRAHVHDYDVVVVNGLWNYATHAARRVLVNSGVPYVVYPHGMLDPWFKRRYPAKHAIKQLLWWFNEGPLLRNARAVNFTTETERLLARDTFFPYVVRENVVAYGTAEPPPPTDEDAAILAAAMPALGRKRFLLFLSRIHEKKGCDLLISAFADVAARWPDVDLVIAGPDDAGLGAGLRAQAERAGVAARIHWPGMLRGASKWAAFRACEAFILPSHQENFGIVVAEALACAKPVLISDQVNIWREVEEDGAAIVAPDTVAGTRELIERFLSLSDEERRAMGDRARASFERRYDLATAAKQFVALAKRLTAERQRA